MREAFWSVRSGSKEVGSARWVRGPTLSTGLVVPVASISAITVNENSSTKRPTITISVRNISQSIFALTANCGRADALRASPPEYKS